MVIEIEEIDRGNMAGLQEIVWFRYLSYTRTSFLLRDEVINWYFISKNVIFIIVSLVGRTEGTTTHSIHHFFGLVSVVDWFGACNEKTITRRRIEEGIIQWIIT